MALNNEETEKIKKQLLAQVEASNMPNKEQVKQYVNSLDGPGLEDFLKKNNIEIQEGQLAQGNAPQSEAPKGGGTQCIFCSIINKEVPSYIIGENQKAIAILEINPLAKGHSIILPKTHISVEQLPKTALSLAQKVAKKIKTKLKPEDIKIETSSLMGHAMINIIPMYKDVPQEKKKAEDSELQKLYKILETKKRAPRTKTVRKTSKNLPKLSFRIP